MKIKLLSAIVVKGHPGVAVGDVIEADDSVASELLSCGYAVKADLIETREPEIEHRDPGLTTESVTPKKRVRKSS